MKFYIPFLAALAVAAPLEKQLKARTPGTLNLGNTLTQALGAVDLKKVLSDVGLKDVSQLDGLEKGTGAVDKLLKSLTKSLSSLTKQVKEAIKKAVGKGGVLSGLVAQLDPTDLGVGEKQQLSLLFGDGGLLSRLLKNPKITTYDDADKLLLSGLLGDNGLFGRILKGLKLTSLSAEDQKKVTDLLGPDGAVSRLVASLLQQLAATQVKVGSTTQ
ncbi:hypothetical protein DCS_02933 [Drechmeria coniospora]|uniref:Uncharacterized protein n=1 Tax=Drechmeria coniospora TaxID=98403 RepID=A0A151GXF6_DRECN|nr:hypothetical protein DCS_02933 [Drechmeria coniospora]KYK61789.1 hypothetical protein DCS_02933 [Drechmeria coniospora]ODA82597.1 hypothetical protein RJ55_01104 [Drechmeria coniospora]